MKGHEHKTNQNGSFVFMETGGHRNSWAVTIEQMVGVRVYFQRPSVGCFSWCMRQRSLYFLTVDDCLAFSLFVAACRALLGRRTIGLYLGISRNLDKASAKGSIKRVMLGILKASHIIEIGSIVPRGLSPTVDRYCDHSLVDLNCIDLTVRGLIPPDRDVELPRRTVSSFGLQTPRRGTELLMRVYEQDATLREMFDVEIYGKLSGVSDRICRCFEQNGGKLIIGWIDEADMIKKLTQSHLVWCLFSPEYDQPSGVLGHSFQLGRPVVLRRGSLLERYAKLLRIDHVACDFDAASLIECLKSAPHRAVRSSSGLIPQYIDEWKDFLLGARRTDT